MFQLTQEEVINLRFQSGTSSLQPIENALISSIPNRSNYGGRRTLPYVFTQEGVAMLSGILHSDRAIHVNIAIMRAFVEMRLVLISSKEFEIKLRELEIKSICHDHDLKMIFDAIRKLMSGLSVPRKRIVGLKTKD